MTAPTTWWCIRGPAGVGLLATACGNEEKTAWAMFMDDYVNGADKAYANAQGYRAVRIEVREKETSDG